MIRNTSAKPALRFKDFKDQLRNGKMSDFGHFYYGKSAPKHSINVGAKTPCVRYGELYSTYKGYISEIHSYTDIDPSNLKFSKGGEVLIPRVGEDPLDFSNASYLPHSNVAIGEMISVYNSKECGEYLTSYIRGKLRVPFAKVVEGGNVSNLYFRYLEKIEINLPSLLEQKRVAGFIESINNWLSNLESQNIYLKRYKEAVLQKILNQQIRFKNNNGDNFPDWENIPLGKILTRKIREIPKPSTPYTAIGIRSHFKGTFQRLSQNPKDISMDNLYVVKENDFIINITFAWEGAAAIVKKDDEGGLVSHRFPTFVFNKDVSSAEYFRYVFPTSRMKYLFDVISPGGAGRNRVLNQKDLLKLKISMPSLPEQEKISYFLSEIDKAIEQSTEQINFTKKWRKGLLQQMFV